MNHLRTVVISITDVCNMRCPQCAYTPPAKKTNLPLRLFERVLSECRDTGVATLRVLGLSEPSLHPEFYDMLAAAAAVPEVNLHVLSNGTSLLGSGVDKMVEHPPDLLEVSIDASSEAVFHLIRGGRPEVYRAIVGGAVRYAQRLRAGRQEGRWPQRTPQLCVSYVRHFESESGAEAFGRYWRPIADEVRFRSPHNFSGRAIGLPSQQALNEAPTGPCGFISSKLFVASNGNIHACTLDFQNSFVLGSITTRTLLQAWDDPQRQRLTEIHKLGEGLPTDCQRCSRCAEL